MKTSFFIIVLSLVFLYGCGSTKADPNFVGHPILKVGGYYSISCGSWLGEYNIIKFFDNGWVKVEFRSKKSPNHSANGTISYIKIDKISAIRAL